MCVAESVGQDERPLAHKDKMGSWRHGELQGALTRRNGDGALVQPGMVGIRQSNPRLPKLFPMPAMLRCCLPAASIQP